LSGLPSSHWFDVGLSRPHPLPFPQSFIFLKIRKSSFPNPWHFPRVFTSTRLLGVASLCCPGPFFLHSLSQAGPVLHPFCKPFVPPRKAHISVSHPPSLRLPLQENRTPPFPPPLFPDIPPQPPGPPGPRLYQIPKVPPSHLFSFCPFMKLSSVGLLPPMPYGAGTTSSTKLLFPRRLFNFILSPVFPLSQQPFG